MLDAQLETYYGTTHPETNQFKIAAQAQFDKGFNKNLTNQQVPPNVTHLQCTIDGHQPPMESKEIYSFVPRVGGRGVLSVNYKPIPFIYIYIYI